MSKNSSRQGDYMNYSIKDDIAIIRYDNRNSTENTLNRDLMTEARLIWSEVRSNPTVKGIVLISGKPDCFISGTDMRMLQQLKTSADMKALSENVHKFYDEIESSPVPVVAAIQGLCRGGGLEFALVAHYRILMNVKSSVLSLPEVMFGIIPGSGGTNRLLNLINVRDALELLLSGREILPEEAKRIRLVDSVIDPLGPDITGAKNLENLEEIAIKTAKQLANKELQINRQKPWTERLLREALKFKFIRTKVLNKSRIEVNKVTKGHYPAPLKLLDVADTILSSKSRVEGYAHEASTFGELSQTPEAKALFGIYHSYTHCTQNHFGLPRKKIETVGIVGSGLDGINIAETSLKNGIKTILKDSTESGSILEFKEADLVIDSVFREDCEYKQKILRQVEKSTRPDCIFATRISAQPISPLSAASTRPENVLGMRNWSLVDKMELVEIVKPDQTSQETISTAVDFCLRIQRKTVIVVKDSPGFYITRCLAVGGSEVLYMLQEGHSPQEIDQALTESGYQIGLCSIMDKIGIDEFVHILSQLRSGNAIRFDGGDRTMLYDMCAAGNLGRKCGKGFFLYDEKNNKKNERNKHNPSTLEIIKEYKGRPKVRSSLLDLKMRLSVRLINEAVSCMEEGIISNPHEGDLGAIYGFGFPPFYGGPFFYLDSDGHIPFTVVSTMERFEKIYGPHYRPCQLLLNHAKDVSKKFYSKNKL